MWRIEQNDFYQKYKAADNRVEAAQPALNIVSVKDVPDSLKSRMVKL
jgi:hypothetical protein